MVNCYIAVYSNSIDNCNSLVLFSKFGPLEHVFECTL